MSDGKYAHADQGAKSKAFTKIINFIIEIKSFEKHFVVLKGLLWSDIVKQHIVTIGIDQLLSNKAMYKHRYLENIKKLYTSAGKYDDQKQYKDILEADMVSTNDRFTYNSPMSPRPYMTFKYSSAIKSLRLCTAVL